MKNYYFNPNSYDLEYIVLANSREEALEFLKDYLWEKSKDNDFYHDEFSLWKYSTIENLSSEYSISEFEFGQVIETERS